MTSGKEIKPADTMEIDQTFLRFCTEEESAKTWDRFLRLHNTAEAVKQRIEKSDGILDV